jgi:molybdate transport system ATP-binding protein
MITARIRKQFPAGPDAAGFTLDVEFRAEGGITVLFGASGAGKTMTLDAIAGFMKPDEGRILLDDAIVFDGAAGVCLPPQRRRCGYVVQNYALFPHMTLRKNLEFAALCAGPQRPPRLERHRKVNEMLDRFHLADVAGRRPHEVSSGEKQRCSIARALMGSPKALLLDEPARGLDASLKAELHDVLREVRSGFQSPILLVTHDVDECFALGDEMLVLHEGRLLQRGTPRSVFDKPASADVARLLGTFNLLPVEVIALDPARKTSRLRYGDWELDGPYFPGRLRGDSGVLCVRPEELTAVPWDGRPGQNQIPAQLVRSIERPHKMRLEFAGGIFAEVPRGDFERYKQSKEWVIEFPAQDLRLL